MKRPCYLFFLFRDEVRDFTWNHASAHGDMEVLHMIRICCTSIPNNSTALPFTVPPLRPRYYKKKVNYKLFYAFQRTPCQESQANFLVFSHMLIARRLPSNMGSGEHKVEAIGRREKGHLII